MGVRGFTHYLMESGVGEITNLINLKSNYNNSHIQDEMQPPIVIIDAMSCINMWIFNLNWLCQGEYLMYRDRVKSFVERLRGIGIEPIFVFDGGFHDKRDEFNRRRVRDILRTEKLFHKLHRNQIIREYDFVMPPGLPSRTSYLLYFECNATVIETFDEADQEIVALAMLRNQNCLGIVSTDSDFAFYPGNVPFLMIDNRNTELFFNTFQVTKVEQSRLLNHLRIRADQLPILASLLGNDVVPYESLNNFHRLIYQMQVGRNRHGAGGSTVLVPLICKFIQECSTTNFKDDYLNNLTRYISIDLYRKSIESYTARDTFSNTNFTDDFIQEAHRRRTEQFKNNVLMKKEFVFEIDYVANLEDKYYDDSLFPFVHQMLSPVWSRFISCVCANNFNSQKCIKYVEYFHCSSTNLAFPKCRNVERCPAPFDKYYESIILLNDSEVVLYQKKLKLLFFVWNCDDVVQKAFSDAVLPKSIICVLLIIKFIASYLPKNQYEMEKQALVMQACVLQSYSNSNQYPSVSTMSRLLIPDPKSIHVAAVFIKCFVLLQKSLNYFHLTELLYSSMPWNCFDGLLYQNCLKSIKMGHSFMDPPVMNLDKESVEHLKILHSLLKD